MILNLESFQIDQWRFAILDCPCDKLINIFKNGTVLVYWSCVCVLFQDRTQVVQTLEEIRVLAVACCNSRVWTVVRASPVPTRLLLQLLALVAPEMVQLNRCTHQSWHEWFQSATDLHRRVLFIQQCDQWLQSTSLQCIVACGQSISSHSCNPSSFWALVLPEGLSCRHLYYQLLAFGISGSLLACKHVL